MTKQEKRRDNYLRQKFGRSLDWYKAELKKQNYRCAICRRKPKIWGLPLAVDHTHKLSNAKIRLERKVTFVGKKKQVWWTAYVKDIPTIRFKSRNKKKAKRQVRLILKQKSVRGLLCWRCNTGIQKWYDRPHDVMRAAKYLLKYLKVLDWTKLGVKEKEQ